VGDVVRTELLAVVIDGTLLVKFGLMSTLPYPKSAMDNHRDAYKILNASFETRYLHLFGRGDGFSAEFIHVLKAVAACLGNGIEFCLQLNPKPKGFAVELGWTDYFESLWPEVSAGLLGRLNRSHFPFGRFPIGSAVSRPFLKWLSGSQWFL